MSRKLAYVEIDVDVCTNVYGRAPCSAFRAGDLNPSGGDYKFQSSQLNGFSVSNATFVGGSDAAVLTSTATDPQLRKGSLTINGAVEYIIQIDIERTVDGTGVDATCFYTTGGHGESGSFRKDFDADMPVLGERKVITLDMSALTVGGTDWVSNTITGIRFDFDQTGVGAFKIYSIRIGHYATAEEATGLRKCFNSLRTCQDIADFATSTSTLRFCIPASYLPKDIEAIPSIQDISFSPAEISLGQNLGQRATLSITFKDHPHSDAGFMADPYRTERGYDPYQRGTFWGKFRARFPYIQGRAIRLYRGELGQSLSEMTVRHYVMESFDGPTPAGTFTIVAKDVLKLADNDRAQAPVASEGYLLTDITSTSIECTLTPTGVGDTYPNGGYAAIGGSEIVRFARVPPGQATNCLLLLHCDGANLGTTFTDSSSYARAITRNGNTNTGTLAFKFGTASAVFDGTDDWLRCNGEAEFAFGTGDFTFSAYVASGLATEQTIIDWRPAATLGNYLWVRKLASGVVVVNINSTDIITGTTALGTTGLVFTRVIVMRRSGVIYLYVDDNLEGSVANTASLLVGAQRPVIGASGNNLTLTEWQGRMDEIAIFNTAVYDPADFHPAFSPFPDSTSVDVFSIERDQYNTTAQAHSQQDRFQLCVEYLGQTPANIIYDLLVNYAAVPASYINLPTWQNEVDTYLQRNYSTLIAEPTGVNRLISELVEQAALAVWWDDLNQLIRLQVLREIGSDVDTIDENIILEDTMGVREDASRRVSQVWTYFALINPLEPIEQPNNYRSTAVTVDLQLESNYGSPAVKKIFSRWIPQFARDTALRLNDLILGRFKDPPRRFSFELFDPAETVIELGEGKTLGFRTLQDDTGERETIPIQITRLNPRADKYVVEAEEALFLPFDEGSLNDRVLIIDSDVLNVNLREAHDAVFPVIDDPTGITLTCIIEPGVIVGAENDGTGVEGAGRNTFETRTSYSNVDSIAFTVGDWPVGLPITIVLQGEIRGRGGDGGIGTTSVTTKPGQDGGTAFYTRYPVTIECADAVPKIAGGGGGGGGGIQSLTTTGGGGGAGREPGVGQGSASAGTLDAGGAAPGNAGDGGGPGVAGQTGVNNGGNDFVGGAAGYSIDGISYVTFSNATPTLLGSTVN